MNYLYKEIQSLLRQLLLIVLLLIICGIVFIYSSSSIFALEKFSDATYFVKKQLLGLLIGVCAMIAVAVMPLRIIKKLAPIIFYSSLILTSLTLLPFFAVKIHGSSRWLALPGFVFQPSEILKFSLILYVAFLLDKNYQRSSFFKGYLPILINLLFCCLVLLKQPDFGLTIVLAFTVFILLFIAQFKSKYLILTGLSALPAIVFLIVFKSYRLKRVLTFLDPWQDPQGAGFQIIQSLIAIGSGSFWGMGISNSKQKFFYLPMQHTDFIFSIISEETGFVGSSLLILLFLLFLYFGLKLALKFKDDFCVFAGLGMVIVISIQSLINLSVAIGIFPTKGIGLPFVSYGNSALISNLMMIGLLINCARYCKKSSLLNV